MGSRSTPIVVSLLLNWVGLYVWMLIGVTPFSFIRDSLGRWVTVVTFVLIFLLTGAALDRGLLLSFDATRSFVRGDKICATRRFAAAFVFFLSGLALPFAGHAMMLFHLSCVGCLPSPLLMTAIAKEGAPTCLLDSLSRSDVCVLIERQYWNGFYYLIRTEEDESSFVRRLSRETKHSSLKRIMPNIYVFADFDGEDLITGGIPY